MLELSKSHKARTAIRAFQTIADALVIRGYYKPAGDSGQALANALRDLSPEIYGSMNDPRITELKGLQYVFDRLPTGIESCTRIILTAEEEFSDTNFEKIIPPKRRRVSYRVSEDEMCFIITRGTGEIYDLLTHLTFLNVEANKLYHRVQYAGENISSRWSKIDQLATESYELSAGELDRALLDLSLLLGRSFHETREAYQALVDCRNQQQSKGDLFIIVHRLLKRVARERLSRDNELTIFFTPALRDLIGHHQYSLLWAGSVKQQILAHRFDTRPLHVISANLHSVINLLYGYAFCQADKRDEIKDDIIGMIHYLREHINDIKQFAKKHGLIEIDDRSGAYIDVQLIDTAQLQKIPLHPKLRIDSTCFKEKNAVLMVMDYAFGEQAFQVMDDLLEPAALPYGEAGETVKFNIQSISIMGKAGILVGGKEDIMLPTAHVFEGVTHNYSVTNDLHKSDFPKDINVYIGPMVTVLGTSLQNCALLEKNLLPPVGERSVWKWRAGIISAQLMLPLFAIMSAAPLKCAMPIMLRIIRCKAAKRWHPAPWVLVGCAQRISSHRSF